MKGIKRIGIIGAAGAALVVGLLVVSQAWAASGTLMVMDGQAEPGGEVTVDVVADVGDPGLGAWTLDITYDVDVISVVSCEEEAGSVCNAAFSETEIRVTGASASGHDGATVLASITFECADAEGSSDLSIEISVFADATIGDPQDIDSTVTDGEIVCAEAEPTAEPTDEPVVVTDIVDTGTGGPTGGTSVGWIIVALAVVGLASMGTFGALRLRRN